MKLLSISLSLTTLLLSLSEHIVKASEGTCLEVQTTCVDNEGKDCRFIPQKTEEEGCGPMDITIHTKWCNNNDNKAHIEKGFLRISGKANTMNGLKNHRRRIRNFKQELNPSECEERTWNSQIDTCESHFNYAVTIKGSKKSSSNAIGGESSDSHYCGGYTYQTAMKRRCELTSTIKCTVMAKEEGGENIPCDQFNHCEECDNGTNENNDDDASSSSSPSSIRKIVYHFSYSNRNDHPLRLDLEEDKYSKIKIGWEEIFEHEQYFKYNGNDIPVWHTREFVKEVEIDVCNTPIKRAGLNLRGHLIDIDTNEPSKDCAYCYLFDQIDEPDKAICGDVN